MNDFKFAFCQLQKYPLSNAVIILTVALLIGAMSVIYASYLSEEARLSPFPERTRMVKLWRAGDKRIVPTFPAALFQNYREGLSAFDELGALDWREPMTLTEAGEPAGFNAVDVSASLLRMTGVQPVLGQLFSESDERPGGGDVVIVSEQLWREQLGGDPRILGRVLRLDGRGYTVVGVLPESMRNTTLAHTVDIWLLLIGAVPGLLIGSGIILGIPKQGITGGINPFDPSTLIIVLMLVGLAGCPACLLPARKAASLNPMEALRSG